MSGDDSAAVKATFDWLSKGLPDEETQRLIDKLNDENDEFDVQDLTAIIQGLQQEISGRPTT
jgi:hypothetical protein